MSGEIAVHGLVAGARSLALAVGDVLEHRGHRFGERVRRQPDPRREPTAVPRRDPAVLDLADLPGKGVDDLQGKRSFSCVRRW
jgi:hypothetical protein